MFGIFFFYASTYGAILLLGASLILSPALYYKGSPIVRRVFGIVVKFVVSMFVMTIVCTIIWAKFIDGKIYDCTDPLYGYLSPDGWVGGDWPVVAVKHVVSNRSIGEPDEIKEGWSITDLWFLWYSLFGMSLVVSILFGRLPDRVVIRLPGRSSVPQPISS